MNFAIQDQMDKQNTKLSIFDSESGHDSESNSDYEFENKKKNISIKKNIVPNEYVEYFDIDFKKKLGKYTFGLDKVIPWEDSNFVFTGGLLYDIINERFTQDLQDIDLFFYGSIKSKRNTFNKLLNNLDMNQYNYLIGFIGSVIYVFIQGVSRIIQLIMTDKTNPEAIVDTFDMTHLQFYFDGNNVFGTNKAISQLDTKETDFTGTQSVSYRLIKYYERGNCNVDKQLFLTNNFVMSEESMKKLQKQLLQKNMYKSTYNLTLYPDLTPINFYSINRIKLDIGSYFDKCKIFYTKPDNKDLNTEINMAGKFINYFHINDKYSQKKVFMCGLKYDFYDSDDELEPDYSDEIPQDEKYIVNIRDHYKGNHIYDSFMFSSPKFFSFYLPCKFIGCENFYFNQVDCEKNNHTYKMGKRIFFELEFDKIEKKLIKLINYQKIEHDILTNGEKYYYCEKKNLKKMFNGTKDLNVILPFENTKKYPDINFGSAETKFLNSNGLLIKSNIYNTDDFDKIYGKDFFENLNQGQSVNCLFRYFIYLGYLLRPSKINFVEVNLQLRYIHIKNN